MTFGDEATADSPGFWWDTRQAVGTLQPDRSANGYTGTIVGAPAVSSDGLTFDGSGQWIEGSLVAPTAYAEFALEVIVSPTVIVSPPSFSSIFGIYSPNDPGDFNIFCQDHPSDLAYAGDAADNDDFLGVGASYTPAASIALGLQHVLLDFDGSTLTLYLGGSVYATDTATTFDIDFTEAAAFFAGDDVFGGDGYLGLIRHALFYDHALGGTRAAAHAAQIGNDPAPAAAAPSVSSVTPGSGSESGGTAVVVAGSELTGVTAVTFGGTPAGSFTPINDGQVNAMSPPHIAGIVQVVVTTPNGSSA